MLDAEKPCGHCRKLVIYDYPRDKDGNILINRLEPISKYWLAENGHRLGKIIEPYCSARCGLDKHHGLIHYYPVEKNGIRS